MTERITIEIECPSCYGTGLYQGAAERDGAFVQCSACKGTGKTSYSYTPFAGRKTQDKCKRVYMTSCGYVITDKDITTKDGDFQPFSQCGCTYSEWLDGKTPKPIKFLGCPMMADQGACHNINGFVSKCNEFNGGYIGYIPKCENQGNKDECWKRLEEGQQNKH